jgi:hypothetical protein
VHSLETKSCEQYSGTKTTICKSHYGGYALSTVMNSCDQGAGDLQQVLHTCRGVLGPLLAVFRNGNSHCRSEGGAHHFIVSSVDNGETNVALNSGENREIILSPDSACDSHAFYSRVFHEHASQAAIDVAHHEGDGGAEGDSHGLLLVAVVDNIAEEFLAWWRGRRWSCSSHSYCSWVWISGVSRSFKVQRGED